MGHEYCGAVQAAVDGGEAPGSIGRIIELIGPIVAQAREEGAAGDALCRATEDANVRHTLAELRRSPVIEHLLSHGKLALAGAKYELATGVVHFLAE
jgi:carbonic anhydrase